jgi:acyl dehydratase
LAAQTLRGLPLPLLRIVNSGCRLELNAPLSADEPFEVQASLESLQSEQGRTLLLQRIITSQPARPQALVVNLRAVVSSSPGSKRSRPEPVRVPHAAKRIDSWSLSRDAGLNFAWLTGDFNPIHWLPAYARAFGFESSILHGFATMARVLTALEMRVFGGATDAVSVLDVRFTRPLGLPATVGLFVDKETVFVGAAGEPAYLVGTFTASAGARCVSHEAQSFEPSQEARA